MSRNCNKLSQFSLVKRKKRGDSRKTPTGGNPSPCDCGGDRFNLRSSIVLDYNYCGTCFRELLLLLLLLAFECISSLTRNSISSCSFLPILGFSLCLLVIVAGKGIEINEWQLLVYIVRGLWLIKQISEADNRKERRRICLWSLSWKLPGFSSQIELDKKRESPCLFSLFSSPLLQQCIQIPLSLKIVSLPRILLLLCEYSAKPNLKCTLLPERSVTFLIVKYYVLTC